MAEYKQFQVSLGPLVGAAGGGRRGARPAGEAGPGQRAPGVRRVGVARAVRPHAASYAGVCTAPVRALPSLHLHANKHISGMLLPN